VDLEVVADVTSRGFYDDPVMGWVFPDPELRLAQLRVSFSALAGRYSAQGGRIDLLDDDCAALWLPPDPPPAADNEVPPPGSWPLFSAEIAARFVALGDVMASVHPSDAHWYLGVLSTVPEEQGRGLGARTIAAVLALCDRQGIPAYLESSNARNLSFYRRHGWEQTGEIVVPDGPTLYPMWRKPR
jgi:GNAT superfamily N-acetyltransferase